MHILYVAQAYFPYLAAGGLPVKVRSLSQELVKRGHQLTILTAHLGQAEWKQLALSADRCRFGLSYSENGARAVYLPSWLRYRSLTLNPGVIGFCRSSLGEFDLVHVFGLYDLLGPAVGHFCARRAIPYLVEPMGMFVPIDRSILAKRAWLATFGSSLFKKASRMVATSEIEKDELISGGIPREKVLIRYNGVDQAIAAGLPPRGAFRALHHIPGDEPLLLFLSRVIPRKGAEILIESFAEACPSHGRLVIAGPEGERGYLARLQRCAQASGVFSRVIFAGPLYGKEKLSALADADLFVLPSRYENFANVVAEAMACDVPVVISRHCGIHTLVEGRAGLVIEANRRALTASLLALLTDSALYSRMKTGCREVAAQLGWSQIAAEMESHYRRVLADSHAAR